MVVSSHRTRFNTVSMAEWIVILRLIVTHS